MAKVIIYTDGGCSGNPGPGGWGTIIVREGHFEELGGHAPDTTNNRMEMLAAIEGLKQVNPPDTVRVVSDSKYLVDGATKWIWGWRKKGWKKSDGKEVLNLDLWLEIDTLLGKLKINWEHVKGHAGHPENERCDDIAQGFAQGETPELKKGDGSWIDRSSTVKAAKKSKARKVATGSKGEKYEKPLYLSIVNGDIREHSVWSECEARIKGVKNSRCKKVTSKGEHIAAIASWKDMV